MVRRRDEDSAGAFVEYLQRHAPRALTVQQIAHELEIDRYDRKQIKAALEGKVAAGQLRRVGKTRYAWEPEVERRSPRGADTGRRSRGSATRGRAPGRRVEGKYARVRAGFGFVTVLGAAAARFQRDILVPSGMEGSALHGDRVAVEIEGTDRRQQRVSGRVVEVVESANDRLIGTLEHRLRRWRLLPASQLLPVIDIIGGKPPRPSDDGLVALVKLTAPPTATSGARGEVERVLGEPDDPDVQFLTIAFEFGLRVDFPEEVLAEAAALPADPAPGDFDGREDLRHLPFITIDGEDARDFDDAVHMERQGDGSRVWVAIADVSHYVRPGSPLDDEATRRGTSAYFPDRAIPMLPPRLSNELCSLNPGRDRLVLVAEMTYDAQALRRGARFYRAVIRSQARLTYTQVAAALDGGVTERIDSDLGARLNSMRDLMKALYANRVKAGSLDLELPEPVVELSTEGRCVGLGLLERNDAHRIIEELMLEANCAVAIFLRDRDVAIPYRIHEPPDPEAVDALNEVLGRFGLSVPREDTVRPRDVQAILGQLRGHRLERALSRQVLRSLSRARYAAVNAGHFGLAFPIYCHFTSPIRRYPDLLVHRQMSRSFGSEAAPCADELESIEAASVASSLAERNAMGADRAMLDLKRAEFMLQHLGEAHAGIVVSVNSFGFFVELDAYPVEGLVRVEEIDGDFYEFVEAEGALRGVNTRRRFRLGDRVVVQATNASLQRRQVEFALLEHGESKAPKGRGARPGKRGAGRRPPAGKKQRTRRR